jgi:hypothetical protein
MKSADSKTSDGETPIDFTLGSPWSTSDETAEFSWSEKSSDIASVSGILRASQRMALDLP